MNLARLVRSIATLSLVALAASCDSREGDRPVTPTPPPPAGKDLRIHEIRDPDSPLKAADATTVQVSGAVVVAVDRYDETGDGKSTGTIYVSDLDSQEPYSGISLYNTSFIPGNLHVIPGDALDLRGVYQENNDVPIKFAPEAYLVQLANGVGTFRFEAVVPRPVEIDITELENYETGRKWLNMLVTVKNVTVERTPKTASNPGRLSYDLLPGEKSDCTAPGPKAPTLVNELTDLVPLQLQQGTVIKSLTGVVTFFCNLHIAPRDAKDIVL